MAKFAKNNSASAIIQRDQRMINLCLNCEKTDCNGNCKLYHDTFKEIYKETFGNVKGQRRMYPFKGGYATLEEMSLISGIPKNVLKSRIYNGWTEEEMISTPYQYGQKHRSREIKT